jgi:hypothetical protein
MTAEALLDPRPWTLIALAAGVVLALVRLVLWQRAAAPEARAPRWRLAVLGALTLAAGVLTALTLFPPAAVLRSGEMIVLTRGALAPTDVSAGDRLIALPEAGPVEGATRVPDLATALRRFPEAARIRVLGEGLAPRDQSPLSVPLSFEPPPRPRGLIDLALPGPVAPGGSVAVGGQVGSLAAGSAELLDPAGAVVDRRPVVAGQRFVLNADVRAPGLALFALRLRDPAGALVERVTVPVEVRDEAPPRVLVLAGAPGPETKFLGRWAQDSGIALSTDIELGAGVRLGDAPVPLNAASLARLDLVVIDDRRWETLGAGGRAALTSAVEGGLGLLLRPTAPLSAATRRDWAALGAVLSGGDRTVPLRLDPPMSARPAAGEAAPPEPGTEPEAEPLPELARRDLTHEGPNAIAMVRDGDGLALATWRARGRGRVGVWTVADSHALVLTGRADRYGAMWSELFSALSRPGETTRVRVEGLPRAGSRAVLCGITGAARVLGPDSTDQALLIDPTSGDRACAALWPAREGWHRITDGQARETLIYAHPADAAPSLAAFRNREATLALAGAVPAAGPAPVRSTAPGPPWPWFIALLVVLTALWGLERRHSAGPDETMRQFLARTVIMKRRG